MEIPEWYNYDMVPTVGLRVTDQSIAPTGFHQIQPYLVFPNQSSKNVQSYHKRSNSDSEQDDVRSPMPPPLPTPKGKRGRPSNPQNTRTSTTISDDDTLCKTCNKIFTTTGSLRRHELTHSDNSQRFSCEECGIKFTQKPSLVTHMKRQHQGKLDYPCPYCEKKYVRNIELQGHIKNRHQSGQELKKVKCPECEKEVAHLYHHMKIHRRDPESPRHTCTICDRTFVGISELNRHSKTHTKEKSLTCPHCPRTFFEEWRLKEHILRTHLVEKKFVSKYCGMKFQYSGGRSRHDKIHETKGICSGNILRTKIFACEFCPERANTELLLKIHMRKTHPEPRLILKKMVVKNISLKENPDSGLFLVRPGKEAKDSGSVCAWHLCLKCGRAFLDLNRARRHNNFCEGVPHHPKSDNDSKVEPSTEEGTVSSDNDNISSGGYPRSTDRDLDPHSRLTSSEHLPQSSQIIDYDDEEPCDFEGAVFPEEETEAILPVTIDHNIPMSTAPSTRVEVEIGHRPNFGDRDDDQSHQHQSDSEDEPVTTIVQTAAPTPSTSGSSQMQTNFELPAALRATTPWQIEHMNVVLTAPKPFQCKTCLKFYAAKSGLFEHIKTHTEPEHCCEFCGQRFALRTAWIYHVRTHTGEKPHKCKFCDYRASNPMGIYSHERTHDKTKAKVRRVIDKVKVTCTVCNKILSNTNEYRNHMYFQHEYDPKSGKGLPHTCTICQKTFAYRANAISHVKNIHRNQVEETRATISAKIYSNFISLDPSLLPPKSKSGIQKIYSGRGNPENMDEEINDESDFQDLSSVITN